MSELFVQNRQVVVAGQKLATGLDYLPGNGAYRLQDEIYANRVGLVSIKGRALQLIPLCGPYIPKANDVIIGKAIDINMHGWRIDTFTAYSAMINVRDSGTGFIPSGADLSSYVALGDYVACLITKVTEQFLIDASMDGPGLRKLQHGQILRVNPMKVPRIIGKQGSMISMIKEHTKCQIIVGQNGVVWLRGTPEAERIATATINLIHDLTHTSGLTERVAAYLEEECQDLDTSAFEAQLETEREQRPMRRSFRRDNRDGNRNGRDNRERRNGGGFRKRREARE